MLLSIESYETVVYENENFEVRIINDDVDYEQITSPDGDFIHNYVLVHKEHGAIQTYFTQFVQAITVAEKMNHILCNELYKVEDMPPRPPTPPAGNDDGGGRILQFNRGA